HVKGPPSTTTTTFVSSQMKGETSPTSPIPVGPVAEASPTIPSPTIRPPPTIPAVSGVEVVYAAPKTDDVTATTQEDKKTGKKTDSIMPAKPGRAPSQERKKRRIQALKFALVPTIPKGPVMSGTEADMKIM